MSSERDLTMHFGTSSIPTFLGGVAVGCVVAIALYETRSRKKGILTEIAFHSRNKDPKLRGKENRDSGSSGGQHVDIFGDEVLEEMFTRNIQFFGAEGQARVSRGFVVVVGLGVRPVYPTLASFPLMRSLNLESFASKGIQPTVESLCRSARVSLKLTLNCVTGGGQSCSSPSVAIGRQQASTHRL